MTFAFNAIPFHGVLDVQRAPVRWGVILVPQGIWKLTRLGARNYAQLKLTVWKTIKLRQAWGALFATLEDRQCQQRAHTARVILNAMRYFSVWTISATKGMMILGSISIRLFAENAQTKHSVRTLYFLGVLPTILLKGIKLSVPSV